MAVTFELQKPLSVRVPKTIDVAKHIQPWDTDNIYPQRCNEAIKHSYTLRSVVNSVADFLAGDGFIDPTLASLVINDTGVLKKQTLNKLLRKVTKTYSRYESIALHIGFDMNYRISSMTWINSDYIRFPEPDSNGVFDYYLYCTNWELQPKKEKHRPRVTPYHMFNPDPEQIAAEIEEAGGIENYDGQILFITPEDYEYPLATFDPVLEQAQTQGELSYFKLGYTSNGFMATTVFKYDGDFESDQEEKDWKALIKRKTGARNANSNIGVQDKTGTKKIDEMIKSLEPRNLDRIFEFTEKSSISAILENEGWPKILIGVQAEGTLFNQESMVDAYTYANAKTRNARANISEVFSLLLSYWCKPMETDAAIKEKIYGTPAAATPATTTNPNNPGAPGVAAPAQTSLNDGVPDSPRINTILTNLNGQQRKALDGIITRYRNGKYDWAMMRTMMRLSVGLSDADLAEMFPNQAPATEL